MACVHRGKVMCHVCTVGRSCEDMPWHVCTEGRSCVTCAQREGHVRTCYGTCAQREIHVRTCHVTCAQREGHVSRVRRGKVMCHVCAEGRSCEDVPRRCHLQAQERGLRRKWARGLLQ
ncbi:hypothetical protein ACRRTK_013333 [Alexandromys fortis]